MDDQRPKWREDIETGLGAVFFGLCLGATYLGMADLGVAPRGPMALAFGIAAVASPAGVLFGLGLLLRGLMTWAFKR